MRALVQRVLSGQVSVDGQVVGKLSGPGLVVLLGVTHSDGPEQAKKIVDRICKLIWFENGDTLADGEYGVLLISQFTLYGTAKKGRKPSWTHAAPGEIAEPLYELVAQELRSRGIPVETGVFGAMMQVSLVNDGPFTMMIEAEAPNK